MSGNNVEIIEGDLVEVKDLNDLLNSATHLFAAHGADNESNPRGYELIDFGGMKEVLEGTPEGRDTHIIYMSSIYLERKILLPIILAVLILEM